MTGRDANRVQVGSSTNAAICKAIAEHMKRVEAVDLGSCPPRLQELIEQLRSQDEKPYQRND